MQGKCEGKGSIEGSYFKIQVLFIAICVIVLSSCIKQTELCSDGISKIETYYIPPYINFHMAVADKERDLRKLPFARIDDSQTLDTIQLLLEQLSITEEDGVASGLLFVSDIYCKDESTFSVVASRYELSVFGRSAPMDSSLCALLVSASDSLYNPYAR